MNITIIDGQGGKIGCMLIERLKTFKIGEITAVGTNSIATSNMLRAGADYVATGESPAVVAGRNADIIAGPLGILLTGSLSGEVTDETASAIGRSKAQKVLIPMNRCSVHIVGICAELTLAELIDAAVERILALSSKKT